MALKDEVNAIVDKMITDDTGNYTLPDDVEANEDVVYAATLVKRQKDTQAAYTRSQQNLSALSAKSKKLAEKWEEEAINNLSAKDTAKLEDLKAQDPDAYIQEIIKLKDAKKDYLKEELTKIDQETNKYSELEKRKIQLDYFNKENPNIKITDDVLANDVPPRITKQLEEGKIDFATFLINVKSYLSKGKAIDKGETPPNVNNMKRGSTSPNKKDVAKQQAVDYNNAIF